MGLSIGINNLIGNAIARVASSYARFNGDSARLMRVAAGAAQPGGTELRMAFTFKQTAADIAVSGAKHISRFGTGAAGGNRLRGSCYLSGPSLIFRLGEDYSGVDGANVTFYGISLADVDATCVIIYDGAAPLAKSTPGVPGNPALYRNGVLVTAGATVVARVGSGNWSVSDRVSIGGKAFTGDLAFIGQLKDVYIGIDDDPGLSNDDFVEKFYKDGSAVALGNGVSVTGNQPFLCMSGDANDWNFANVSSSETDWYMRGKGVDYPPEVNKIAWRKPYVISEVELGVNCVAVAPLVADDVATADPTLPLIGTHGVRFANSYGSATGVIETLVFDAIPGIGTDPIDDDLPIHAIFWNNHGHSQPNSLITFKVWHNHSGAAEAHYTTFSYSVPDTSRTGFYSLPIIPAFAGLTITDGDGHLPAGCTVTPELTPWTGVAIDRIEVGFSNFHAMRKSPWAGWTAVGTLLQFVRGRGHTPSILITADDGNSTLETEVDVASTHNVFQICGARDSGTMYPDGLPISVSLIDAGKSGSGHMSDAQLDTAEGQADVNWTTHGSYAITTNIFALPCTITTPFAYYEIVTQSTGSGSGGSGRFLGVIPGGMLIGIDVAKTPDALFDDPVSSETLTGAASGAATHVTGQIPATPTATELLVEFEYQQNKIMASRGTGKSVHYVAPQGAIRNGTQEITGMVHDSLELAGFATARGTAGGIPTVMALDLETWGAGFIERMGIGGVSIEDTGECPLTSDLLTKRIDLTLNELGGCFNTFFHTPAPDGGARGGGVQPNIPINEFADFATGVESRRTIGGLKVFTYDDYFNQVGSRLPRGATNPLDHSVV